jgi:hypothetical protein
MEGFGSRQKEMMEGEPKDIIGKLRKEIRSLSPPPKKEIIMDGSNKENQRRS